MGVPTAEATATKATADHLIGKMEATDAAEAALDGARSEEGMARTTDIASLRARVRNWKTLSGYAASGSEGVLKLRSTGGGV